MSERKRLYFLLLIMTMVAVIVVAISIYVLYAAAIDEERTRLVETAQSQARLIEAITRFNVTHNKDFPGGPVAASLDQIRDAHKQYKGFGETGEFALARREGDNIVFLLRHRHNNLEELKPVPFDPGPAEPMRRALLGKSGALIGPDYRGEIVLAAYEPVAEVNLGIVAKIDLKEIRAPFVRAGVAAAGAGILVVVLGAMLFLRVSNPMIRRLQELYQTAHHELAKRRESQIQLKNSRAQLRALAAHLQSVREEEGTRVARELHDELSPTLTALMMDLSWLASRLTENQQSLRKKMESMSQLIETTVQSVRKIAAELRPGVLDDLGLAAAIEWHAEEFQTRTGIRCKLSILPQTITLDRDRTTAIFRIFQELLTNVARHSSASRVDLTLRQKADILSLEVRDNGRGIVESEIASAKSLGLIGIRERALVFGGEVQISGTPGKGTTVTVWIPMKPLSPVELEGKE